MRRILCVILGIFLAPLAHAGAGTDAARFLRLDTSARAASMGGAFAALSNDASSLFYNPAGLALLTRREVLFTHIEYIEGLNNETLVYVYPADGPLNYAFGGDFLLSGDMRKYNASGVDIGEYSANEGVVAFGVAGEIVKGVMAGGVVKSISQHIGSETAQAYALDMGLIKRWDKLRVGVAAQNLGTRLKLYEQESALPKSYVLGVAYPVWESLWVSGDLVKTSGSPLETRIGAEAVFKLSAGENLYFRMGYKPGRDVNTGPGVTAGLGVRNQNSEFNYGVTPFGDFGYSHLFTFSFKLKGQKAPPKAKRPKNGVYMW